MLLMLLHWLGAVKTGAAMMLLMRLLCAQLWKKRDHDAADVAPPVGDCEEGGGNDAADASALRSSGTSEHMMLLMLLHQLRALQGGGGNDAADVSALCAALEKARPCCC